MVVLGCLYGLTQLLGLVLNWKPEFLKPLLVGKISAMGPRARHGMIPMLPKTAHRYHGRI